jgi:hypothetical protein
VAETKQVRLDPSQAGYAEHCRLLTVLTGERAPSPDRAEPFCQGVLWGVWGRLAASTGVQGWVLLQVSPEGA